MLLHNYFQLIVSYSREFWQNKMSSSACPTAFNPLGLSIKSFWYTYFSKKQFPNGKITKKCLNYFTSYYLVTSFRHQFSIFMADNSECCDQLILLPSCLLITKPSSKCTKRVKTFPFKLVSFESPPELELNVNRFTKY